MDQNAYTYNSKLEEVDEETLSLCDLSLENYQDFDYHYQPNSPTSHEFSFIPNTSLNNNKNDIVFCGKLIKLEKENFDDDDDEISRYLFPLSSARLTKNTKKDLGSVSFVKPKPISSKSLKSQSFSSSSSSSSSRKHKVLIGLAKVPPKMELSDIKKRQSRRRTPQTMFPPTVPNGQEVVSVAVGGGSGGGKGYSWSLLRALRNGTHLVSSLAKGSLGCIPHV